MFPVEPEQTLLFPARVGVTVMPVTVTLPVIVPVIKVAVLYAVQVYVPAVCTPKEIADPVPATDAPTGVPFFKSWYETPTSELLNPTATPEPPKQ